MISNRNAAMFCAQFATLLESGVPIDRALASLRKSAGTYGLRRIAGDLKRRINKGETLTQALAAHRNSLPRLIPVLVEVGEQTGRLDDVLSTLAGYYDTQWNLTRTAWSHLLPMIVYFGLCGALIVFIHFVQRQWDMEWLARTATNIGVVAAVVVAVVIAIRFIAPLRALLLTIGSVLPIVAGIMRQSAISRFAMAMRATLGSGIDVRRAIDLAADATTNPLFALRVRRAKKHIENGKTIAEALARTRTLPSDAMAMIETGELGGRLVDSFGHVAVAARFRATTAARTSLRLFTILIYVGLLAYVAYVIISMWGAHYRRILDLANPDGV